MAFAAHVRERLGHVVLPHRILPRLGRLETCFVGIELAALDFMHARLEHVLARRKDDIALLQCLLLAPCAAHEAQLATDLARGIRG